MSEIEKMYENAGIKPTKNWQSCLNCKLKTETRYDDWGEEYLTCDRLERPEKCSDAKEYYPIFTADKQLELIKTIERKCDLIDCIQIVYRPMEDLWKITIIPVLEMAFEEMYLYFGCDKDFSTALAMAINNLWQDLTEVEKQQVKGILE